MTRSRKKTPITGMTTAESDKAFKSAEHRRERSAVKTAIKRGVEPPDTRKFGDPAVSEKDGKQWFDPGRFPEYLRK